MSKKETGGSFFKVGPESSGLRIDRFLSGNLNEISRSRIQKLISEGEIRVNGVAVSKHHRLSGGEKIEIGDLSGNLLQGKVIPEDIELKVVYEDDNILVISKEAGMLTHPCPGKNSHTLVNALLHRCMELSKLSGEERAGIVHRLDRDTSGLLITAKNDRVHHKLSQLFSGRKIKKTYSALATGNFPEEQGRIELPLGRSRMDRRKMAVSVDRGREAVTWFEVVEKFKGATLLDVHPQTGRTHQIRVHLSYIGHPVVGDEVYGNKESQKIAEVAGLERQFLHARKIEFIHPVTGKNMVLEDDLPQDLKLALDNLRKESA
ncbi:MAG: RluA family pseudouridine synthase [Actinobacteria bacterium]|nr:RluA family pseudouridine synthase [Actinomycetota bacterium]